MSRPRASTLRIRRARRGDAAAIARVMSASIRALAARSYAPRQIAAWSSLPALYHAWAMTAGGERVVVAERGGRVLGYAALRGSELTALFVRPSAAGRGVGKALLARVEGEARRRGVASLRVDASRNGAPFYRARGFAGARHVPVPLPGGLALDAIRMRKRLGRADSTPGRPSVNRKNRSPRALRLRRLRRLRSGQAESRGHTPSGRVSTSRPLRGRYARHERTCSRIATCR